MNTPLLRCKQCSEPVPTGGLNCRAGNHDFEPETADSFLNRTGTLVGYLRQAHSSERASLSSNTPKIEFDDLVLLDAYRAGIAEIGGPALIASLGPARGTTSSKGASSDPNRVRGARIACMTAAAGMFRTEQRAWAGINDPSQVTNVAQALFNWVMEA